MDQGQWAHAPDAAHFRKNGRHGDKAPTQDWLRTESGVTPSELIVVYRQEV